MSLLVFVAGILLILLGQNLVSLSLRAPGRDRAVLTTNADWRRGRTTKVAASERRRFSPRLVGILVGLFLAVVGCTLLYVSVMALPITTF